MTQLDRIEEMLYRLTKQLKEHRKETSGKKDTSITVPGDDYDNIHP